MSKPLQYFLDEHMRPPIADQLRLRGVDVQTTVEAARAHQAYSDESQLQYATQSGRVLVTEDSDTSFHCSLILCEAGLRAGETPAVQWMQQVIRGNSYDFVRLSQAQQPHSGVVYFPVQLSIGSCVEYLELLALTTSPDEMRNQLVYGKW